MLKIYYYNYNVCDRNNLIILIFSKSIFRFGVFLFAFYSKKRKKTEFLRKINA